MQQTAEPSAVTVHQSGLLQTGQGCRLLTRRHVLIGPSLGAVANGRAMGSQLQAMRPTRRDSIGHYARAGPEPEADRSN